MGGSSAVPPWHGPAAGSRPAGGLGGKEVGAGGWTQRQGGLSLHLASLARGVDRGAGLGADGGRLGPGSGCGSRDSGRLQGAAEDSEACGALGSVTWGQPWKIPPAAAHPGLPARTAPAHSGVAMGFLEALSTLRDTQCVGLLTRDMQPPKRGQSRRANGVARPPSGTGCLCGPGPRGQRQAAGSFLSGTADVTSRLFLPL